MGVYVLVKDEISSEVGLKSRTNVRKLDLLTGHDVWSPPRYIVHGDIIGGSPIFGGPRGISVLDSGVYVVVEDYPESSLHKFDFNGTEMWTQSIGMVLPNGIVGNDTGLYVIGVGLAGDIGGTPPAPPGRFPRPTLPPPIDDGRAFLRKYNFTGHEVWTQRIWVPLKIHYPYRSAASSVTVEDNAVYMTGTRKDNIGVEAPDPSEYGGFVFHSRVWGLPNPKVTGWERDLFDLSDDSTNESCELCDSANGIASHPRGGFL